MANGFFLGGMAEGMETAERQRLARDQLAQELALRTRGLDITERGQTADIGFRDRTAKVSERAQSLSERNAAREAEKDALSRADKHLADTMSVIADTVKTGLTAGNDPAAIQRAVAPLVDSAKRIAPFAKRDPANIEAQVGAFFTAPTATQIGMAEGRKSGAAAVSDAQTRIAGGIDPKGSLDPKQKIDAENALRDDYMKQSQPFIVVRDFYSNMQQADNTGAGDITRVFAFMKMQDPNSAVLPGEYATAQNAAGVPDAVRSMYNKLIGGGTLGAGARTQIENQAKKLFESRGLQQDKLTTTFAQTARRQGLNIDNSVPDIGPATPRKSATGSGKLDIPAPPAGFKLVP